MRLKMIPQTGRYLYRWYCCPTFLQILKLPDGTVKVLVEGTRTRQSVSILCKLNLSFLANVEPVANESVT